MREGESAMDDLLTLEAKKKLKAAGERQGWWNSEGMVVALSGGGDSVSLLWLLHNFYKGRLVAAHLDHCTRQGVSHEDAEFARNLCREWGIECRVKVVEVYAEKLTGESFEMAGRRERYTHFYDTAAAEGLPFIAVGHSADDRIETQLMNLFRGTGLAGLRGIPETRGMIIRPIIDFRRDELRQLLRMHGVTWREDASNADTVYKRNKVREELIPWIKKNMNPNFENVMIGLARQVDEELAHKSAQTAQNIDSAAVALPPAIACWSPSYIKNVSDAELIDMLRMQGAELGLPTLSRDRTIKLAALMRRGGCWRFQWAGDIEICYSDRGVGWLHRADIRKGAEENKQNTRKDELPWWAR